MAVNIEVKHLLRELEARIKALEDRPIYTPVISKEILDELARLENAAPQAVPDSSGRSIPPSVAAPKKKMCPKCGVKPAYFFHVRACAAKNSRAGG